MAPKSDKETPGRKSAAPKKSSPKSSANPKTEIDGDDEDLEQDDDDDVKPSSVKALKEGSKKKSGDEDDEDDVDIPDEVDEWEKPEEEDSWDPDFEEFDVPKSKVKKSTGKEKTGGAGTKKPAADDDLGVDDDFKEFDLFNDSGFDGDDDDDY